MRALVLLMLVLTINFALMIPTVAGGPYRDYDAFMGAFMRLVDAYPSVATFETIGKTVENKDIIMFKIGNPSGGRVLFDGAMHGWETLGSEMLYLYAEWLLTSGDPQARRILARDYTLLIPALNVDKYNYARKNANGVDLNRNFCAMNWMYGNSDPSSDYYRGQALLSEPESQALVRVFEMYKPDFYINLHFPGGTYYAGSYLGDKLAYQRLVEEINILSHEREVTPYNYTGEVGALGFAVNDATRKGITSFLMELSSETLPLSQVETEVFPRFIPVAIVLSQACEVSIENPALTDINRDGKVDIYDTVIMGLAHGSKPGSSNWNQKADVNSDGEVNFLDSDSIRAIFGASFSTLVYSFNSRNTTTIFDYSNYANNGKPNGASWVSDGVFGGAWLFDGDDIIIVEEDPSIVGNGTWTEISVEFWIKPSDLQHGAMIVLKAASGSLKNYAVGFKASENYPANTLFWGITTEDSTWYDTYDMTKTVLEVNTWNHVVCTYRSGSGLTIYINGAEQVKKRLSGAIQSGSNEPLFLGCGGEGSNDHYFKGLLDEVRIYPIALSANQVSQRYSLKAFALI